MSNFKPDKNVSFDEQLIFFKDASQSRMQMSTKAEGVVFETYSLCVENYLYNFLFASRVANISKLKKKSGLTDSSGIGYCLCETLTVD